MLANKPSSMRLFHISLFSFSMVISYSDAIIYRFFNQPRDMKDLPNKGFKHLNNGWSPPNAIHISPDESPGMSISRNGTHLINTSAQNYQTNNINRP